MSAHRRRPHRACEAATHDETRDPGFVADTWNVMTRELKPMLREPASVLFAMVQPLVFLGALRAAAAGRRGSGSALQWFVPGIIAMTALMGASMTGSNLTLEINTGSHERLLVSPLSRSSLLVGRALKEVVPMLAQAVLIIAVVTPFSFELHLGGILARAGRSCRCSASGSGRCPSRWRSSPRGRTGSSGRCSRP